MLINVFTTLHIFTIFSFSHTLFLISLFVWQAKFTYFSSLWSCLTILLVAFVDVLSLSVRFSETVQIVLWILILARHVHSQTLFCSRKTTFHFGQDTDTHRPGTFVRAQHSVRHTNIHTNQKDTWRAYPREDTSESTNTLWFTKHVN